MKMLGMVRKNVSRHLKMNWVWMGKRYIFNGHALDVGKFKVCFRLFFEFHQPKPLTCIETTFSVHFCSVSFFRDIWRVQLNKKTVKLLMLFSKRFPRNCVQRNKMQCATAKKEKTSQNEDTVSSGKKFNRSHELKRYFAQRVDASWMPNAIRFSGRKIWRHFYWSLHRICLPHSGFHNNVSFHHFAERVGDCRKTNRCTTSLVRSPTKIS